MNIFKKIASTVTLVLLLVSANHAFAFSGAGTGTLGDPYMVTSCSQLNEIAFGISDNYQLSNDIDCSSGGALSFGTLGTPFTGDFDGAGYTVSVNISSPGTDYVGLFGAVAGAHIHDVRITGSILGANYTGGIAAVAEGATVIERVVNEAAVRGHTYVGGIIASATSVTISNSYNTGAISSTAGTQVGGITGVLTNSSSILNSYNRGQIGTNSDSVYHIAGLTGWRVNNSTITNSFNSGAVLTGQSTFFFGGLWGNDQDATSTPSAGLTNNFFDISRSTRTMCGYNNSGQIVNPVSGQCEGENINNFFIHYFKDDSTRAPLDSWDFTTIWETNTDGYPSLRSIANDGGPTYDDPDVTGPVISEVTPVTTPTRAYTQSYTFTTDEAGTILFGGACSMSDGTATVGSNTVQFNLGTGTYTDCTIQVRDTGNNLSNSITVTSFTVDHSFLGVGDGSEDTPYRVTTCEELQSLRGNVEQGTHVTLWNDVDCSATATWNEDPDNLGTYFGFVPIPNFDGVFVGGGHTISGLTIHNGPYGKVGLFTQIDGEALVYGFNLTNMTVSGGDDHVGGLAGTIYGTVVGVHVSGDITSSAGRVGGFAGLIQSSNGVSKSSFTGTVTGGVSSSGGFTGYAVNTTISDSYARATVNGGSYAVGGFVGATSSCCTYLTRNYATGSVTAAGGDVGGFVGYAEGGSDVVYLDNFAANTVTGGVSSGAFMGRKDGTITMTSNYYDSTINSTDACVAIGGDIEDECVEAPHTLYYFLIPSSLPLSHWNFTNVWRQEDGDYPTLLPVEYISSPTAPQNVSVQINGLNPAISWEAPTNDGGLPIFRYRVEVKRSTSSWADPLVINEGVNELSYTDNGNKLDYGETYDVRIAGENILAVGEYSDPVAQFTVGTSTSHDISSCAQLQAMDNEPGTYTDTFNLTQNIDCSGIPNFRALGNGGWNNGFRGVFDGHGYTISNLTINLPEESDVGLFKLTDRATIKNVTLQTGSVTGYYTVGALVGYSYETTFSNVHSDLAVTAEYDTGNGWGAQDVGGLIGYIESDGATDHYASVSNSSSSGVISGNYNVGGLVGRVYIYPDVQYRNPVVSITNNAFTGTVSGDIGHDGNNVGGLVGYMYLDSASDDHTTTTVTVSGNTVTSSNIYGTQNVGGAIGYLESYLDYYYDVNNITIASNMVNVTVHATDRYAGGLIGYIDGYNESNYTTLALTVQGNSVDGTVTADSEYAGGLIGYDDIYSDGGDSVTHITYSQNRSRANIGSMGYSGGLVGYFEHNRYDNGEFVDTITQNYATGTIGANGGYVGGLFGAVHVRDHDFRLANSYFNGTLGSTGGVGGIIGFSSSSSGGAITLIDVYTAGSVAAYASGGDAGGLVGRNDAGTLYIYNSFAANTMIADHQKGSVVGNNNLGATLTVGEVYYDEGKNSVGCVDDQTLLGCTPVNTVSEPDLTYFFNNADKPVFQGESGWNFETIWATQTDGYPILRTTFTIQDVTPPILTTVTAIAASTTVANAVYHFTSSEVCTVDAEPVYSSVHDLVALHVTSLSDGDYNETAYLEGIRAGGTYSFAFHCFDVNNNTSNTISSGLFTVVAESSGGGSLVSSGRSSEISKIVTQPATVGLKRNLKMGMKGVDVKTLQQLLNKKGFLIAKTGAGSLGKESTLFGTKTKQAIVKFQKANKLKADGVVGPKTWALLNK